MNKLTWLLLLIFLSATNLTAQQKPLPGKAVIEKALKEIKDFNTNESKKDSISGHLLGSNKDEDFKRRYRFYQSVYAKLNGVNKASISFNDQVNLELLQYSIEDEISSYTFKAYLNPILSDDGFHTDLAYMGSEVLSTKKEFEKYITKLKDIPRYVEENFFLMRKGHNEYLPKTRTTIGASNFPDGLAYYQERVHHYTTTDLSYEEIYQLGLQEVARIKKEMLDVMKEVNFTGTLQEFINFLRTDPKFYAPTAEQLLKEASYIAKKADNKLPMLFGKLPRQPYGVEPVPAHLAPTYTAGRYSGAPINSKRAGHYWVNTYDLKSRPLYALESLTLHEAVPGHHLQIALAKELTSLPEFRRNLYVNAFGEGWGLYCEYLGTEMDFYKDPYSRFGKLTYEMWRACRLVLDAALHTKGWTREQAVTYLAENTALSLHEVNTEINRYISWPGQALAYKMGELKIKELRKKAEEKLKDKFDVREFHDLILSQGTVTLTILDKMVDRYIAVKLKPVADKKGVDKKLKCRMAIFFVMNVNKPARNNCGKNKISDQGIANSWHESICAKPVFLPVNKIYAKGAS